MPITRSGMISNNIGQSSNNQTNYQTNNQINNQGVNIFNRNNSNSNNIFSNTNNNNNTNNNTNNSNILNQQENNSKNIFNQQNNNNNSYNNNNNNNNNTFNSSNIFSNINTTNNQSSQSNGNNIFNNTSNNNNNNNNNNYNYNNNNTGNNNNNVFNNQSSGNNRQNSTNIFANKTPINNNNNNSNNNNSNNNVFNNSSNNNNNNVSRNLFNNTTSPNNPTTTGTTNIFANNNNNNNMNNNNNNQPISIFNTNQNNNNNQNTNQNNQNTNQNNNFLNNNNNQTEIYFDMGDDQFQNPYKYKNYSNYFNDFKQKTPSDIYCGSVVQLMSDQQSYQKYKTIIKSQNDLKDWQLIFIKHRVSLLLQHVHSQDLAIMIKSLKRGYQIRNIDIDILNTQLIKNVDVREHMNMFGSYQQYEKYRDMFNNNQILGTNNTSRIFTNTNTNTTNIFTNRNNISINNNNNNNNRNIFTNSNNTSTNIFNNTTSYNYKNNNKINNIYKAIPQAQLIFPLTKRQYFTHYEQPQIIQSKYLQQNNLKTQEIHKIKYKNQLLLKQILTIKQFISNSLPNNLIRKPHKQQLYEIIKLKTNAISSKIKQKIQTLKDQTNLSLFDKQQLKSLSSSNIKKSINTFITQQINKNKPSKQKITNPLIITRQIQLKSTNLNQNIEKNLYQGQMQKQRKQKQLKQKQKQQKQEHTQNQIVEGKQLEDKKEKQKRQITKIFRLMTQAVPALQRSVKIYTYELQSLIELHERQTHPPQEDHLQ